MNRTLRSLLALGTLTLAGVAQAAIPPAERQVLLDLYSQTNGSGWTTSTGWNGAAGTECSWYGIVCDDPAQSHVISIQLVSNHLSGTLPALTPLANLQLLNLGNNQLAGAIPSLSGLASLQQVFLNGNQLSGGIPSLSGLTNLAYFQAAGNQLSGPIPALSGLTALVTFAVDDNQLTGSIPSLAGLGNLAFLGVSDNQLSGSIPSLSGLSMLSSLSVGYNQLTGAAPLVPNPNSLAAGQSDLCPNALAAAANPPSANDQAWNAATGTTPWSQQCTLSATYTVTSSSNAGGSIMPASQTVNAGATAQFTVAAANGYVIAEIIDNCGAGGVGSGTFAGGKYTTGTINTDCRVDASFAVATPPQVSVQAPVLDKWALVLFGLALTVATGAFMRRKAH